MLQKSYLFLLLLFCSLQLSAKDDDKVVLKEYKTVYEFTFNKRTAEPLVRESYEMLFEALHSNAEIVVPSFYDESSSLSRAEILDNRNRRAAVEKVCGNYEDRDIFFSDTKFCAYRFIIGSTGETARFSSSKEYTNPRYFTSVYFPFTYAAQTRVVEFHVPEWLNMELKEFNFEGYDVIRTEELNARKKLKIIRYTVSKLPAYEDGPFLPGKSYTYPHVLPIIKSFDNGAETRNYMSSTADLYAWYVGLVREVKEDNSTFASKVKEITAGKTTELEKIRAIFYWVQDNIRYIAFEDGIAGFKPEASQKVYQNRYGDCKGMANLTKQMLLQAGFDARLAWIGTNHLAYNYQVPSLAVDNHMICVVVHNNEYLVLDATEKFISLTDYAERIQGKELLIENKEGYLIHKIPQLPHERNKKTRRYQLSIENGTLKGKGKFFMQGESRTALLQVCNNVRNEGTENLIKNSVVGSDKNTLVKSLEYSSLSERERPFTIDVALQIDNNLMAYNDEYYFQPDINDEFTHLEMEEDRLSFLDFKEKINHETEVRLQIPKGYSISYLPKGMTVETENFSFLLNYKVDGNEVVFSKKVLIPSGKVPKSAFEKWNATIKSLKQQHKEQIVLSKK